MRQYSGLEHARYAVGDRLLRGSLEHHPEANIGALVEALVDRRLVLPARELLGPYPVLGVQRDRLFHRSNREREITAVIGDLCEERRGLDESRLDLERLFQ